MKAQTKVRRWLSVPDAAGSESREGVAFAFPAGRAAAKELETECARRRKRIRDNCQCAGIGRDEEGLIRL